jgi:putative FmdB family regulatory protein
MPIYEYACKQCDMRFEKLVRSMSSSEKIECPKCGSTKTARALSVFAVGAQSATKNVSAPPMCGRCGGAPGSCQLD